MTEFFNIPHMVISRDDVEEATHNKAAQNLSDDQMTTIAEQMEDGMMEAYWTALVSAAEENGVPTIYDDDHDEEERD